MTKTTLRIASYNIRKARGLDQKRRPDRILRVINGLNADVVVLQEADKRFGPRVAALPASMVESETDFRIVEVARNDVSLGWHGNAVLVEKHIRTSSVKRIELPGFEPRGAVRVDIDVGAGLSVFATHLGLLRRNRRAQLRALQNASANIPHAVIAGDFNEWSQQKGLEPLADKFSTHSPGHSFHARRPVAALDRFALTEGINVRAAGVEQGALARRASDHLPIWMDLSVPVANSTC